MAIDIEKSLRSASVQEGLNTAVPENTVKTPVAELDAILMVLEKGVHGTSSVVRYLEFTPMDASTVMPQQRPAARTFSDLLVWRKAHAFVLAVYKFSADFPKPETYGLAAQMRRAAVSIPANIAEGFRRRGKLDKARFMKLAEGLLEGCRYYFILAEDLGYGATSKMAAAAEEVLRIVNAYAAAIPSPD